jgi:hypothetical protein
MGDLKKTHYGSHASAALKSKTKEKDTCVSVNMLAKKIKMGGR